MMGGMSINLILMGGLRPLIQIGGPNKIQMIFSREKHHIRVRSYGSLEGFRDVRSETQIRHMDEGPEGSEKYYITFTTNTIRQKDPECKDPIPEKIMLDKT
jgi:hypothetical protein